MEFKDDLKINDLNLQEEVIRQSELYSKYALEHISAGSDKDKAKSKLDLVRAELDSEIRADPGKFNVVKVTESAISAAILCSSKYQDSQKELQDKREQEGIMGVAKDSFLMRASMLKLACSLVIFYGTDELREDKIKRKVRGGK